MYMFCALAPSAGCDKPLQKSESCRCYCAIHVLYLTHIQRGCLFTQNPLELLTVALSKTLTLQKTNKEQTQLMSRMFGRSGTR